MQINFKEVDRLEKGLRKVLKKNRCLSKKEKKSLNKANQFFKNLENLKKRKRGFFEKSVFPIIKFILKLM
jgi:hypothetical protein